MSVSLTVNADNAKANYTKALINMEERLSRNVMAT
jgi:hypothetical protein